MQTSMETGANTRRWAFELLRPLLALALAAAPAIPAIATSLPTGGVPAYRIIHLSPDKDASAYLNASGQVAFNEYTAAGGRSRFYDGRHFHDVGSSYQPNIRVAGLNDHGQVIGTFQADPVTMASHAFIWSRTTGLRDLHPPGQENVHSQAVAINNRGQVIASGANRFVWSEQTGIVPLATFGSVANPTAINDAGVIVGGAYILTSPQSSTFVPVRWTTPASIEKLFDPGLTRLSASDINARGQIVGCLCNPPTPFDISRAYVWTPQQGLALLPADDYSVAMRINDAGVAIGLVRETTSHGAIWVPGKAMVEIGEGQDIYKTAVDLNKHSHVVGAYDGHAYIWTSSAGVVDLNNRVPDAPDDLVLTHAAAIADDGSILARANTGLVLLVPRPGFDHPPVPGPIAVTGALRAGALISFAAGFRDHDRADTHSATWDWGDNTSSAGMISSRHGAGSVSGQHAYPLPGSYTVTLTVVDSAGNRSSVRRKIVVRASAAP